MSVGITWLAPAVLATAVLVALPILIHLLARDRSVRVLFPSLRFLDPGQLAAVRRRSLQDLPLLLVRAAIVLLAVAALAGPIFITPARNGEWSRRVARAVILHDRSAPPDDELRTAAVGATFARERLSDAVDDAVRWLSAQDLAHREIVVLSGFRRGAVTAADFVAVPPEVGIRPVRTGDDAVVREREITRIERRDAGLMRITDRIVLSPDGTTVTEVGAERLDRLDISVSADPPEQAKADAALRAVLRRGIRLPPSGLIEPITVRWPGSAGALALAIERRLHSPIDAWEPERLTDAEVAALSRPSSEEGTPSPADAGDRRVLWGIVLIFIGLETWMRRWEA